MNNNIIQEFPTTHVLIDDNINYLRGLSTILPLDNRIYRYFTDPNKALNWIKDKIKNNHKYKNFKCHSEEEINHKILDIDINNFHQAIYSEDRFHTISTIIVDFDMPGMSGLELCKSIEDSNIQKILLTGFLGDREARQALNKGWIDMFLPKGEDSSQKISELILDANNNYFEKSNNLIDEIFKAAGEEIVLKSPILRRFFTEANEYYLLDPKGDYLLIDANGSTLGFSVQNEERIRENIELAKELGVSKDITRQLQSKKAIFCFYDQKELPSGKHWKDFVFDAICIDKNLIGAYHPEIFKNKAKAVKSFNSFLNRSVKEALEVLQ